MERSYWFYLSTAAVTFAVSLGFHLATFFGHAFYEALWLVPLLFVLWPLIVWHWRRGARNKAMAYRGTPRPYLKYATLFFAVYLVVNYLFCNRYTEGAYPEPVEGRWILKKGDRVLRALDASALAKIQMLQVRMLTGHLLVFHGFALLALIYLKPRIHGEEPLRPSDSTD